MGCFFFVLPACVRGDVFFQLFAKTAKTWFLITNLQANWWANGAVYFLEISVVCLAWLGLLLAWPGLGLVWAWPDQGQPQIKPQATLSHSKTNPKQTQPSPKQTTLGLVSQQHASNNYHNPMSATSSSTKCKHHTAQPNGRNKLFHQALISTT